MSQPRFGWVLDSTVRICHGPRAHLEQPHCEVHIQSSLPVLPSRLQFHDTAVLLSPTAAMCGLHRGHNVRSQEPLKNQEGRARISTVVLSERSTHPPYSAAPCNMGQRRLGCTVLVAWCGRHARCSPNGKHQVLLYYGHHRARAEVASVIPAPRETAGLGQCATKYDVNGPKPVNSRHSITEKRKLAM